MQSHHRSRGKILFEIFCALAVSASCVGAWMQTGAWALLMVAFVAALYGFSHAFDLKAPRLATAVDPTDAELTVSGQDVARSDEHAGVALTGDDRQSTTEATTEKADSVEPATGSSATAGRRAKTRRKSGGRRTKGAKEAKSTELAPPADVMADAEQARFPLVPLFEPQPFMRHTRVTFGRKDNLA